MPVAGPLAPCPRCRLVFPDDAAARRHALLDHTAADDGAALVEALLRAPRLGADEPAREQPEPAPASDLGVRLGLVLAAAWLVALVALLVSLPG